MKKTLTQGSTTNMTEYLGDFQYLNGTLQFVLQAEGYVKYTAGGSAGFYNYVYHIKDHLGNIRVSFTKHLTNNIAKLLKENHYYPFGLKHSYNSTEFDYYYNTATSSLAILPITNSNRYQYNSKEWQNELNLNLYDYGARMFDPAIGRWGVVDPLAEKYGAWSPYNYAHNNPIKYIDWMGLGPDDWVEGSDGIYWDENATSQATTKDGEYYLGYDFSTESTNGLQTNYNSDGTFDHHNSGFNLDQVTISSKRIKNSGATTMTIAGVVATPVGGLLLNIGLAFDKKGFGLFVSGGIAHGVDVSVGFEVSDHNKIFERGNTYIENLRGEGRSNNFGAFIFDYSEGGNHEGQSQNIYSRESTIQSHTVGASILSPIPAAYSRQVESALVLRIFNKDWFK